MSEKTTCPRCSESAIERHRVASSDAVRPSFEVQACTSCGEYWVEGDGTLLTPEALRDLGLLS